MTKSDTPIPDSAITRKLRALIVWIKLTDVDRQVCLRAAHELDTCQAELTALRAERECPDIPLPGAGPYYTAEAMRKYGKKCFEAARTPPESKP